MYYTYPHTTHFFYHSFPGNHTYLLFHGGCLLLLYLFWWDLSGLPYWFLLALLCTRCLFRHLISRSNFVSKPSTLSQASVYLIMLPSILSGSFRSSPSPESDAAKHLRIPHSPLNGFLFFAPQRPALPSLVIIILLMTSIRAISGDGYWNYAMSYL